MLPLDVVHAKASQRANCDVNRIRCSLQQWLFFTAGGWKSLLDTTDLQPHGLRYTAIPCCQHRRVFQHGYCHSFLLHPLQQQMCRSLGTKNQNMDRNLYDPGMIQLQYSFPFVQSTRVAAVGLVLNYGLQLQTSALGKFDWTSPTLQKFQKFIWRFGFSLQDWESGLPLATPREAPWLAVYWGCCKLGRQYFNLPMLQQ